MEQPCFVLVPLTFATYCCAPSQRIVGHGKNISRNDRGLLLRIFSFFLYPAFLTFPVLFALPSSKHCTLSVNKGMDEKGIVKSVLIPCVRGDV